MFTFIYVKTYYLSTTIAECSGKVGRLYSTLNIRFKNLDVVAKRLARK